MLFAPKSQNGFGLIEFIVLIGLIAFIIWIAITLLGPALFASDTIKSVQDALPQ